VLPAAKLPVRIRSHADPQYVLALTRSARKVPDQRPSPPVMEGRRSVVVRVRGPRATLLDGWRALRPCKIF
jgi:hypothetical protein